LLDATTATNPHVNHFTPVLGKSLLILVFTTIKLCLLPVNALAEKITIDAQTPRTMKIQGRGKASIVATEIAGNESTTTGSCSGFVSKQANYTLVLTNFVEFLKISVNSEQDTTLIVKGPGGVWCNDDDNSQNPAIFGQWQVGTYSIWIGSYSRDTPYTYTLEIDRDD
jgi:hypothetical protein